MNYKKILFAFLLLININSFSAATLYSQDGSSVESGSTVCADAEYYLNFESEGIYANIVNSSNNMLLSTINAKNGELTFSFSPDNTKVRLDVYEYANKSNEYLQSIKLNVEDCGYEQVVEPLTSTAPQFSIKRKDGFINLTAPSKFEDYKLYYNFLEEDDNGNSKEVKFKDGVASIEIETNDIQFIEEYTNLKDKEVKRYYEVSLDKFMTIRKLKSLDLSIIEPMSYLDKSILLRILIGLIFFIVLYLVKMFFSRALRAKRRERKLELKRRQKRALQKQELERQRRQEIERKKQKKKAELADQKRRNNLEIRK